MGMGHCDHPYPRRAEGSTSEPTESWSSGRGAACQELQLQRDTATVRNVEGMEQGDRHKRVLHVLSLLALNLSLVLRIGWAQWEVTSTRDSG